MPKANEQVGDYTLVRRIGRGSFGQVWLAEDRTGFVTTQVAIKFINDENTPFELVEREARVWVEASGHPNIISMMKARKYKVTEDENYVVFISEYAKEGSLENWLKANNSKAPDEQSAIKMMLGILTGLEYLHNKKILHRDLKPANVLLQNAIPKLADFGLSKIRASINKSSQNTFGTPAYMSPEAFQTKGAEQADIWAAGIIFYEMLAGRLPFEWDNAWAIMFAITTNKPKELPKEVSREIQEIIYKALEKDLTKRYQTPKEMLLELEKVEKILATKSLLKAYTFETITLDSYAKVIERKTGQAQYYEEDLGEGVKLEMVEIPAGTFLMGTSEQDKEKVIDEYAKCWNEEDGCKYVGWEMPQHQVTVSSFYIGKYEITQEQWEKVMGKNPSYFKGKKLPVEQVSWNKAVEFCKKLSAKTGHYYRLPSEAEWEYAARGATTTAFAFGETITPSIVNYDGNYPYADAPKGEYRAKTIEVGSLGVANAFGLYDMHGNVWEWCQDPWHDSYKDAPTDGSIWEVGNDTSDRVVRGGSWCNYSSDCRAALRYWLAPGDNDADSSIGLRVVLVSRTLH